MTTFNTGNAVPSADARDRFDNSQTFDEVINGTLTYYANRVGSNILSLKGMADLFNAAQLARAAEYAADKTSRDNEFLQDQAERELLFQGAQDAREVRFDDFISSSGYEVIGDYAVQPVTFTERNQLMVKDGELWKPKASVALPYTTTGVWGTESANFVSVGDAALRQQLGVFAYGANLVYGASRQVLGFAALSTTQGRYNGDRVDVVSHVFPFPASGPAGARSFAWVATSTLSPNGGTVAQVTGVPVGRWIFQGIEYRDVDFGVVGDGTDETAAAQAWLNAATPGSTVIVTKRFKANGLVLAANSVRIDSNSAAYLESPGIDSFAVSTLPLLKITGYGCTIGTLWASDGTVDFGTVNAGSIGVEFRRADGKKDLDAYVSGLNVSKFATGLHKVGINCRTLGGGNIFSHCLDSVVADQVTESGTLQDVRGIVVGGGARFHGRPTMMITGGVSAAIAGSLGTDILINGTVQRENQFFDNLADGSGKHFRGQLGRGCKLTTTSVRTPGGDAVAITGGVGGDIGLLSIGGGEGNGLVFEGGSLINVGTLKIDTVFKHGVVLRNCSDISFVDYKVMNVNGSGVPADAGLYSGFSIESTAVLTTLGAGRIRQTGALSGDVGIDNQGNQTKISPECDALNFTNGPIRQSPTQRVYGDIGLMSNRPLVMYASAPPTTGTYGNGDRCKNNSPTIANPVTTWMYTVGALWRPVEWQVFSGSTSLRPVLRPADVGVTYLDTTLSGKQIVWNGAVWKDATGANV